MEETKESGQPQQVQQTENEALHRAHYKPYSVLVVGTELAVLSPESPVRKRIFSYSRHFEYMNVLLLCGQTGAGDVHEGNVSVFPTNSQAKITRYWDAYQTSKLIGPVDIVSAQDPFEVGFVAWWIARSRKVPLHLQVHTDFLAPEYAAHSLLNKIRVMIAGFVIRRAGHVRCVSEIVEQRLKQVFGDQLSTSVLPIFTDLSRFRNVTIPPDFGKGFARFAHRMLVVARMEPEKRISLAITAFKEAAQPDSCLIILGTGSEYTLLERHVTKLGLDGRVFFEGYADPAPYYQTAEILLVPSVYEGYGQVIIEALASGKPVLATDVGIARTAGAMIASAEEYPAALKQWVIDGPRTAVLQNYPYESEESYVEMYCDDIARAKKEPVAQGATGRAA